QAGVRRSRCHQRGLPAADARHGHRTRRLWWTKDTAGNSFTIHLTSSRSSTTKVSWLLLG
ncbi:MAG: hypothetical protein LH650_07185, partial [Chloroflexi bacterium]|nr:hypothetical protein [Chloroflexota bacterium]